MSISHDLFHSLQWLYEVCDVRDHHYAAKTHAAAVLEAAAKEHAKPDDQVPLVRMKAGAWAAEASSPLKCDSASPAAATQQPMEHLPNCTFTKDELIVKVNDLTFFAAQTKDQPVQESKAAKQLGQDIYDEIFDAWLTKLVGDQSVQAHCQRLADKIMKHVGGYVQHQWRPMSEHPPEMETVIAKTKHGVVGVAYVYRLDTEAPQWNFMAMGQGAMGLWDEEAVWMHLPK